MALPEQLKESSRSLNSLGSQFSFGRQFRRLPALVSRRALARPLQYSYRLRICQVSDLTPPELAAKVKIGSADPARAIICRYRTGRILPEPTSAMYRGAEYLFCGDRRKFA